MLLLTQQAGLLIDSHTHTARCLHSQLLFPVNIVKQPERDHNLRALCVFVFVCGPHDCCSCEQDTDFAQVATWTLIRLYLFSFRSILSNQRNTNTILKHYLCNTHIANWFNYIVRCFVLFGYSLINIVQAHIVIVVVNQLFFNYQLMLKWHHRQQLEVQVILIVSTIFAVAHPHNSNNNIIMWTMWSFSLYIDCSIDYYNFGGYQQSMLIVMIIVIQNWDETFHRRTFTHIKWAQ